MARLNQTMRKLQSAVINAGQVVKLNTHQFYSEEKNMMITTYSVITSKWSPVRQKMVDHEMLKTCSTVEVVKFLANMLEGLRNGTKP